MVLSDLQLVEYPIGFPPPVVLGLGEFGLPVVAVHVRPVSVCALQPFGSEKAIMYQCVNVTWFISALLFLFSVPRTVVWRFSRKFVWMRLYGVWVEDLCGLGEVHLGDLLVDVVVPVVVAEHQQGLRDPARLR